MSNKKGKIKRAGYGYKRILNKNSQVVGYLKGSYVYDKMLNLWGRYTGKRVRFGTMGTNVNRTSDVTNSKQGKIGYFDDHSNLFDIYGHYIGTLQQSSRKMLLIVPVVLLILALAGATVYLGSYYIGSIGKAINIGEDIPTLQVGSVYNDGQSSGLVSWEDERWLDILNSPIGNQLIMPGANGTYDFVVGNGNKSDAIMHLVISDKNEYNIPMKFRLRMNNVYVAGGEDAWVGIEDLDIDDMRFASQSKVLFSLDWKWDSNVSDAEDTLIGSTEDSSYTLNFAVYAETYE